LKLTTRLIEVQDSKLQAQDETLKQGLFTIQSSLAVLTDYKKDNSNLHEENKALEKRLGRTRTGFTIVLTIMVVETIYIIIRH
jgi:hypothetical protein